MCVAVLDVGAAEPGVGVVLESVPAAVQVPAVVEDDVVVALVVPAGGDATAGVVPTGGEGAAESS